MKGLFLLSLLTITGLVKFMPEVSEQNCSGVSRSIASIDEDEKKKNECKTEDDTCTDAIEVEEEVVEIEEVAPEAIVVDKEVKPKDELQAKFDTFVCDSQLKMDSLNKSLLELTARQNELLNVIVGLSQMLISLSNNNLNTAPFGMNDIYTSHMNLPLGQNSVSSQVDIIGDKLLQEYVNLTKLNQPAPMFYQPNDYYYGNAGQAQPLGQFDNSMNMQSSYGMPNNFDSSMYGFGINSSNYFDHSFRSNPGAFGSLGSSFNMGFL
jgi:hypothetical protein